MGTGGFGQPPSSSSTIFALISRPVADSPSRVYVEDLDLADSLRRMTTFDLPGLPLSSISMKPSVVHILTNELSSVERPKIYVRVR